MRTISVRANSKEGDESREYKSGCLGNATKLIEGWKAHQRLGILLASYCDNSLRNVTISLAMDMSCTSDSRYYIVTMSTSRANRLVLGEIAKEIGRFLQAILPEV
ncbi:uncharacterized protein An15g04030 [Aspergillus niger]|uniref:Contig An15c0140, genomic contig n=2 Tax=Aspergillus niger TaxID=5061 RepID=A5ABZ9_ASPNC|nr:uncharacterized protein An15g04030 [Aspergillus niger]CAK97271.1 unnamed protein product [Aspergillus niger]